jgi:hypothetical protein
LVIIVQNMALASVTSIRGFSCGHRLSNMGLGIESDRLKQSESLALNIFNGIGESILCDLLPQSPGQAGESGQRSVDMIVPYVVKDFFVGEDAGGWT